MGVSFSTWREQGNEKQQQGFPVKTGKVSNYVIKGQNGGEGMRDSMMTQEVKVQKRKSWG